MGLRKNFNYIKVNNFDFEFKVTDDRIIFYRLNAKEKNIVRAEQIFGKKEVYRFKEHFFTTHIEKIIEAFMNCKEIPKWEDLYRLQFKEIIV